LGKAGIPAGKEGIPAGKAGIPAGKEGIPAGKEGIPAGKEGIPAGKEGIPAGKAGIPAGKAGIAGKEGIPAGKASETLAASPVALSAAFSTLGAAAAAITGAANTAAPVANGTLTFAPEDTDESVTKDSEGSEISDFAASFIMSIIGCIIDLSSAILSFMALTTIPVISSLSCCIKAHNSFFMVSSTPLVAPLLIAPVPDPTKFFNPLNILLYYTDKKILHIRKN
jgi:hypothetical protein